jgi:Flp pilus assembly protein TadD
VIETAFLEMSGRIDDGRRILACAQRRWPEVAAVRVAQGIVLAAQEHFDAARKSLETAVALGAHSPETYYALAGASVRAGPDHLQAARSAMTQARKLTPDDPRFQSIDQKSDLTKLVLANPPDRWLTPKSTYLTV